MKLKKIPKSWYFLGIVVSIQIVLAIIDREIFESSWSFFSQTMMRMIPIFILIFILMTLSNYFITKNFVVRHLNEKGLKKWIFVVLGGILSSGPIYMWYPLLADLKKKGINHGEIACFLYNRAIKIPLIPLAIAYFGLKYLIILLSVMVIASVLQGIIINKLIEPQADRNN